MRHNFLFIMVVVFGIVSCKDHAVSDSITVDFTPNIPEITVMDVIPLETRDDVLLDQNYKLYPTSDYYVAQDKKQIVIFDRSGRIINTIRPVGRGPGEVVSLINIWADDRSIKILDAFSSRIIEYDYRGNPLNTVTLDFQPTGFCPFNETYLFEFQNGQIGVDVLAVGDRQGNILKRGIELVGANIQYGTERFQLRERHALYLPAHSNTVYRIDDSNEITRAYTFDFGNHWAGPNIVNRFKNPVDAFDLWNYLKENDMIGFLKFKETDEVILLNFERGDGVYNWFYEKASGDQYLIRIHDPEAPLAGSRVLAADGNSFIFGIDAFDYRNYPDLPSLDVSESDNPVLVIGRL